MRRYASCLPHARSHTHTHTHIQNFQQRVKAVMHGSTGMVPRKQHVTPSMHVSAPQSQYQQVIPSQYMAPPVSPVYVNAPQQRMWA